MKTIQAEVCKVGDLKDGEMREMKVGERKVLLSRVKGQYYATSHLCTHYKAQLSKGTLSQDGRVMCPWHGACFRVQSGEIEDAPGLDPLAKFEVKIEGDKVIVIAEEEVIQAGRSSPQFCLKDPSNQSVVAVLGGGPAGMNAIEVLRQEGFSGRILLVSKEAHLPIDRVKLSKGLKVELDKILLRPKKFFEERGIELLLGKEVVEVDRAQKKLLFRDATTVGFDQLIIATGGIPRNFWAETKQMKNIFAVRGISDAEGLEKAVQAKGKPKVLIVGSSFIGMEAAAVLVKNSSDLTVVGMEKVPFERVLGERIGLAMQRMHEEKGVKFRMNVVIKSFEANENGECVAAVLTTGEKLPCDIAVLGVGVAPDTDFLKKSFQLEKDGSVVVDQYMAVVGAPGIYAAGDMARYPFHLPHGSKDPLVRIEHWNIASQQGRHAALAITGKPKALKIVPYFWTMQYGRNLRFCGHAQHFSDIIVHGNVEELTFAAYFVDGERILAVASLGKDPVVSHCSELMRLGKMPSASEIRAGKDVLTVPITGILTSGL